jgi:hypothetical protein
VGITYCGPYADIIEENNRGPYPHEGYATRVMPDGTLSGSWGGDVPDDAHIGFRAACACGWAGTTLHPPGDHDSPGYQAAEDEWRHEHLQKLIDEAAGGWIPWAERIGRVAGAVATDVQAGRLDGAVEMLRTLADEVATRQHVVDQLAEQGR